MDDVEIAHREGEQARAAHYSIFDNPFYAVERLPRSTGESLLVWAQKLLAWEAGWRGTAIPRTSEEIAAAMRSTRGLD